MWMSGQREAAFVQLNRFVQKHSHQTSCDEQSMVNKLTGNIFEKCMLKKLKLHSIYE